MGKIAAIISLVVLLGITGADAAIFTIELPELVGDLEPYPNNPTVAFDFGTSFLSIDEVRIQLIGTFTPRVVSSMITVESLELTPEIDLYMDPGIGSCYVFVYPLESPFDVEGTFALKYDATWDFLLDGTDEVAAYLGWGVCSAEVGDVIINPGSVEVSQLAESSVVSEVESISEPVPSFTVDILEGGVASSPDSTSTISLPFGNASYCTISELMGYTFKLVPCAT